MIWMLSTSAITSVSANIRHSVLNIDVGQINKTGPIFTTDIYFLLVVCFCRDGGDWSCGISTEADNQL